MSGSVRLARSTDCAKQNCSHAKLEEKEREHRDTEDNILDYQERQAPDDHRGSKGGIDEHRFAAASHRPPLC